MPQQAAALDFDEAKLAHLLHEHFEIDADRLRGDATFEQLELDSLALMELVVVIENETGAELPDEQLDIAPSTTLAEAGRLMAEAVAATASAAHGTPDRAPDSAQTPRGASDVPL